MKTQTQMIVRLVNLSIKRNFKFYKAYVHVDNDPYEISVRIECPLIDYRGTLTWTMEDFHVEEGCRFVSNEARRTTENAKRSRLTIEVEDEKFSISDDDGTRIFHGDEDILQDFVDELLTLCRAHK